MIEKHFIVRYRKFENRVSLPPKINSSTIIHFVSAINEWRKQRKHDPITIDFAGVRKAYPEGMLPIIAIVARIRLDGNIIFIRLPNDKNVRDLFHRTNWAFLLDPSLNRGTLDLGRHLHARQFGDYKDVPAITNDFMDIVLGKMRIPRDIVSALEWSMYEICDNVINHSESPVGGFVEAVTYSKERMITFTVADAGRGILTSLKEGFPSLRTNIQAIGEAIKAGVTRNKEVGQGNGLAGSLRITTMSGGSLDVISGAGRLYCTGAEGKTTETEGEWHQNFQGTVVSGKVHMAESFSIEKALEFNGIQYTPSNIIEMAYEMEYEDSLLITVSRETIGVGTRRSGKYLRIKAVNLIMAKPGYPLFIDWTGIPVISSSFADEFIGKLFVELGEGSFKRLVKNIHFEPLIQQLLDKAISQRIKQSITGNLD